MSLSETIKIILLGQVGYLQILVYSSHTFKLHYVHCTFSGTKTTPKQSYTSDTFPLGLSLSVGYCVDEYHPS